MSSAAPAFERNGQPVAREAFYAIACDPRRSVAVEACAGAGKTWMLVSRMLRALLDGAQWTPDGELHLSLAPHDILAITFTKKAAGEMRQRLLEWLAEFAHAEPAHLVQELCARGLSLIEAEQTQPKLAKLHAALLACDRPVQIRTFHSWFAALLRSAPLSVLQQLGLPANYELLEDDAPAVALVWRRFYAALLADAQVRAEFAAVVAVHGRHQTQKALASALSKRVEFALADAHGVVAASVQGFGAQFPQFAGLDLPEDLLWQAGAARELLWQAAKALGAASAASYSAMGVKLETALTTQDADAVLAALLTKEGTIRKFNDKLTGIGQIRQAQALVQELVAARAQHAAWLYQQRMARVTRVLLDCFAQLKRERGWVDMNDVERAALVLLGDPALGGWIAQRLDARIRHLLIDEFQDTNPLQWQALHAWLSSYAGAGGGGTAPSVFIVGDPKQSIYRFRRAEPQVFRAAQAFVREGLGGDLLSCDHTRRNAPAVVAVVNAVMQDAQAAHEYEGFRAHSTESKAEGRLACLPQIPRDAAGGGAETDGDTATEAAPWRDSLTQARHQAEETLKMLEARQAAAWIAQTLAQGHAPKDIMVLARKRERLTLLQEALREQHIAAQQPEKTDLYEAAEVQDVVALLDALVSPTHDLCVAQALKSPIFGLGDEDLVHLAVRSRSAKTANADQQSVAWFELLQAPDLPLGLAGVGAQLQRWRRLLAELPPHDALVEMYHEGQFLQRFAASASGSQRASVLANVRGVLAAALQLDASRYATPYALVRALKAGGLRAPVSVDANAVRLLTVHGAKGLEAPIVLLLDTDAPPARAESMSVLVDWPGEAAAPERFLFLTSEAAPPACALASVQAEQAARAREEVNALYVAMTRAKQQLVLSSMEPHRAAPRSWWQRLFSLAEVLKAPVANLADAASPTDDRRGAAESRFEFVDLPELPTVAETGADAATSARTDLTAVAPRVESPEAAESAESLLGQAMHRLLEWARPGGEIARPGSVAFAAQQVQAAAAEFGLDQAQAQQAVQMAQRIVNGAGAWAWDGRVIDWQGNEVSLNWRGQSLRLDRLVHRADTDEWWVLDYKSASRPQHQPELLAQLADYRAAVQAAYPAARVRAAFLTAEGAVFEPPNSSSTMA